MAGHIKSEPMTILKFKSDEKWLLCFSTKRNSLYYFHTTENISLWEKPTFLHITQEERRIIQEYNINRTKRKCTEPTKEIQHEKYIKKIECEECVENKITCEGCKDKIKHEEFEEDVNNKGNTSEIKHDDNKEVECNVYDKELISQSEENEQDINVQSKEYDKNIKHKKFTESKCKVKPDISDLPSRTCFWKNPMSLIPGKRKLNKKFKKRPKKRYSYLLNKSLAERWKKNQKPVTRDYPITSEYVDQESISSSSSDGINIGKNDVNLTLKNYEAGKFVQPKVDFDIINREFEEKWFVYAVLDLNILLYNFSFLQHYINIPPTEAPCYFVIPYKTVLFLDTMLSDKAVRHAARRANEFINRVISESHPKIIGQPATEAKNSLSENLNLDKYHDSLINCCLQLKTRKRNVVLLAGDPFLHSIASDFSVDVQYKTSFQKEMINLSCLYKLYLSDNLGLNTNIKVLSNKSGLHEIRPIPTEEKTESKDITLLSYDCLFSFYIRTSNKICYDIIRNNNLDGGIHLDKIYEFNELKECTSSIKSGLQGYINKDTTTVERSYLYRFQRAIEKIKRLNFVKQFNNPKLGTVPPFKLKDSEEYLSQTSSEILSKHLREFETIYERQEKVSEEIGTKLNI